MTSSPVTTSEEKMIPASAPKVNIWEQRQLKVGNERKTVVGGMEDWPTLDSAGERREVGSSAPVLTGKPKWVAMEPTILPQEAPKERKNSQRFNRKPRNFRQPEKPRGQEVKQTPKQQEKPKYPRYNAQPMFYEYSWPMIPPTFDPQQYELFLKLQNQIEYYFSENNLISDMFLRRNMDSYGLIPLQLLLDFPRVKGMNATMYTLQFICFNSPRLELVSTAQGDKVRKMVGWENWVLEASLREPQAQEQTVFIDSDMVKQAGGIEQEVGGNN